MWNRKYAMLAAKKHKLTISSEIQKQNISFEEVLVKALYEANAVGVDENQLFDELALCCENLTHQNRTDLIAALLEDHNFNGFKKILNFRSKTERREKIVEGRL